MIRSWQPILSKKNSELVVFSCDKKIDSFSLIYIINKNKYDDCIVNIIFVSEENIGGSR